MHKPINKNHSLHFCLSYANTLACNDIWIMLFDFFFLKLHDICRNC